MALPVAALAAIIAVAAAVAISATVFAIYKLWKNNKKDKDEPKNGKESKSKEKEKGKGKEDDRGKDKDKTKSQKGDDKSVSTQASSKGSVSVDKPETKMVKMRVNGVEGEYLAKLNKKTGKYQVSLPMNKKAVQDSIIKVSNSNNKEITTKQQEMDKNSNKLAALKEKTAAIQSELDEKKEIKEQLNLLSKVVTGMNAKTLTSVLGDRIVEFDNSQAAPVVNQSAAMTKEVINNAVEKEIEGVKEVKAIANAQEDLTNMEPKVIKKELQTSLEAANKAKKEEKSASLS